MNSQLASLQRIPAMIKGGAILGEIKQQLQAFARPGTTFTEIEALAQDLIKVAGLKPSFSTVDGYKWATCIMKNDELCHGIPGKKVVESGDIITIDVGLIKDGYHLDTTISFGVGKLDKKLEKFLSVGKLALQKAIDQAKPGASVFQISKAMQKTVQKAGYGVVYQLTGHGAGEQLHMDPAIPCVAQRSDKRLLLREGQTLAIEIMYSLGKPDLKLDKDGWTYRTIDGSLSAIFEETVLVSKNTPLVMTAS